MTSRPLVAVVPRIAALDVLRGFALGGILVVNITVMANPDGLASGPVRTVLTAFCSDKFYVLFSFLFGYSLTLQFRSAERDGADVRLRTMRRCAALMTIGLLHVAFLFSDDVLFGYGLLGLILLAMNRIQPKTALGCAAGLYGTFVVAVTVLGMNAPATVMSDDGAMAAVRAGWLTAASYRWEKFFERFDLFLVFGLLNVLPLFLLGFAAGKTRLLETPDRYLSLLPKVQWIGFGIAAPFSLLTATLDNPSFAGVTALLNVPLAAAYAATILRLAQHRPRLTQTLGTAGKFAATNYIGQSVIASVIFTGNGFALVGRLPDWLVLLIAVAIYAMQLGASQLWARRHRYGPIEWVLRRATYGPQRRWPARDGRGISPRSMRTMPPSLS